MRTFHCDGRVYTARRCNDDRDGLALEVLEVPTARVVDDELLEIFYHDADGHMTFTAFKPDLPVDLIVWSIQQAHALLPLQPGNTETSEIVE
jgi:hypothetical protein